MLEKNEELEELKQKVEELSEKINDLEQNQEEKEESFDSQNNNLREINQLLIQYGLSDWLPKLGKKEELEEAINKGNLETARQILEHIVKVKEEELEKEIAQAISSKFIFLFYAYFSFDFLFVSKSIESWIVRFLFNGYKNHRTNKITV